MIKAILFDVDGTLLNTKQLIYQAYAHVLTTSGYSKPKIEDVMKLVGRSLKECYEILAPGGDYEKFNQLHRDFQLANINLCEIYPGAEATLQSLKDKGFLIATVTSRQRNTLIPSFELTGILNYFDVIVAADDTLKHKPDPEPVLKALDELKIEADEAIFVGDAAVDIISAKAAGVKTVGVTHGFGGEALIESKPDHLIHNLPELLPLLGN